MTKAPANTSRKQDGTFAAGHSGNPAGKPKGARHQSTQAAQSLLAGEAEALTRKAITRALGGDMAALNLCLDKILPSLKPTSAPIMLETQPRDTPADMATRIIKASLQGELPPDMALQMVKSLVDVRKLADFEQFKQRLTTLENAVKGD